MDRRGNESLNRGPGKIPDLKGHLPELDGYRGLAMILALLHHYILPLPGLEHRLGLHPVAEVGRIGLDLFFVLSGFLITGILLDTRGQPHYFRNFYVRRSLRIVPLYYAVLVFFMLVLPMVLERNVNTLYRAMMWAHEAKNWPWYFGWASNFLFVKRNGFAPSGLDMTWSLGIEEQYYLSWAILVFLIGSRRLVGVCIGLIAAALAVRAAMLMAGASWIQIHVMTFARMDALSMGGLVAVLMRSPLYDPERFTRWGRRLAAAAVVVILALIPLGSLRHDTKVTLFVGYTLVGLLASGSLVALIHLPDDRLASRIFQSRFLRFFGRYSYAIYLVHLPIRDALRRRWFSDEWITSAHGFLPLIGRQFLLFAVSTGIAVAFSLVSWNLYEKQWLKLKRKFPRFSRAPKVAVPVAETPLAVVKPQ